MIPKYSMDEDSTWGKISYADCSAIKAACARFWTKRGRTAPGGDLVPFTGRKKVKKSEKKTDPKALPDRRLEKDPEKGSDL